MITPELQRCTKRWMRSRMRSGWRIRLLLLATLALSVSACGTLRTVATLPNPAMAELEQAPPSIDRGLLAPCPPLPLAQSGKLPDLEANHRQVTQQYHDCRAGKSRLIEAVKTTEAQDAARRKRAREAAAAAQH